MLGSVSSCNRTPGVAENSGSKLATVESKAAQESAKSIADSINAGQFNVARLDTCTSPSGLVIAESGPSDILGQLYFFKDGKIVNRYYNEEALSGEWELENDTITIHFSKRYFRKGVGDPIPLVDGDAVPGNYLEQYREYLYLSEDIDQREHYHWPEVKSSLKQKGSSFQLVSFDLQLATFESIINLKLIIE
jgi:hypothetical protein